MDPKREVTSVDLVALTRELSGYTGAKVDKAYLYGDDLLRLKMRDFDRGRVELLIEVGEIKRAHAARPEHVPDAPGRPPNFAKMLRKSVENVVQFCRYIIPNPVIIRKLIYCIYNPLVKVNNPNKIRSALKYPTAMQMCDSESYRIAISDKYHILISKISRHIFSMHDYVASTHIYLVKFPQRRRPVKYNIRYMIYRVTNINGHASLTPLAGYVIAHSVYDKLPVKQEKGLRYYQRHDMHRLTLEKAFEA